jgi:uncharacterized membrane protein YgcG
LPRLLPTARRLTLAFLLAGASVSSFAIPLADMRVEDLILMGPDFKTELALNTNQATLWSQIEAKTRQLIRERTSRRDHLQAAVQKALDAPNIELRDMVGALNAETDTSAVEQKQLREWWLTVNDALNETQRRAVATFFAEQILRVDGGPAPERKFDDSGKKAGGHGRGGMGGMGGAGGGSAGGGVNGVNVGNNGINVQTPGD